MAIVSNPVTAPREKTIIQLLIDLRLSYAVIATGLILLGFFWNGLEGFGLKYISLIVGMFFANVFIFIVNDYFDAADDTNDPEKHARNLFCSPDSIIHGKIALYISLGFSLIFSALSLSIPAFMLIVSFLFLSLFYSAPPIKLRDRAYWDWIFVFLWKGCVIAIGYVYFFGMSLSIRNGFFFGTLVIIMVFSLVSQMENQIRDFNVDATNYTGHSVQKLGQKSAILIKKLLIVFLFAFSFIFCYLLNLYITMILILLNISLYYFASPEKYDYVIDFANQWFIVLFLEYFIDQFSYRQQILFSAWILAMIGLSAIHIKRTNLFTDIATKYRT